MTFSLKNTWVYDFLSMLYPETCAACGKSLQHQEELLCLFCEHELPQTDYHLTPKENPIAKKFWGRVELENVAAFYFFSKGSKVQRLVHALKYKSRQDIGIKVGEMYGEILAQNADFQQVNSIIPIPLHPTKLARRGYNQSEALGQGLANSMDIPLDTTSLVRNAFTETQTRKTRFDRWENVEHIFKLEQFPLLENKHILLVDDVITSGSTIEAAARPILKLPNAKVSVVSMACALDLV